MPKLKCPTCRVHFTNWERPRVNDWELCVRARALHNIIPIAAANRIGFDKSLDFFGHSKIIGPLGNPIAAIDTETAGYIHAEIDYQQTEALRHGYYSIYQDAHPETYAQRWAVQGTAYPRNPKTGTNDAEQIG